VHCRFSADQLAFRSRTGLGVCRVFATRYVTRVIHGTAVYLGFDTYNWWHAENKHLHGQVPEATERWEFLSQPTMLAVMHVLGVMLFRCYLPFMSMAGEPQTVGSYRRYVVGGAGQVSASAWPSGRPSYLLWTLTVRYSLALRHLSKRRERS